MFCLSTLNIQFFNCALVRLHLTLRYAYFSIEIRFLADWVEWRIINCLLAIPIQSFKCVFCICCLR